MQDHARCKAAHRPELRSLPARLVVLSQLSDEDRLPHLWV